AGADLEHAVVRFDLGGLRHQRHDVGLRDGLARADRQRAVLVGEILHAGADETLARHRAHRGQHARVADAAPGQVHLDHAFPRGGGIGGHGAGPQPMPSPSSPPPCWRVPVAPPLPSRSTSAKLRPAYERATRPRPASRSWSSTSASAPVRLAWRSGFSRAPLAVACPPLGGIWLVSLSVGLAMSSYTGAVGGSKLPRNA